MEEKCRSSTQSKITGLIYKLRKMNIRKSFAILSYLFRMSANKLSYAKFTKELRKNYERDTKELRNNYDVYKYLSVNKMAHM